MPYKEIEELEEQMKSGRSPAQVAANEPIDVDGYIPPKPTGARELLPTPEVAKPSNYKSGTMPASQFSAEKVVNGVAPDYSGYDDMLAKMQGMKPKDSSMADLVAMGLSMGVGIAGGQVGAAAKVAGDYGLERAAKSEKRDTDLESMIQKLQLQRAAQMAKGVKGVKVKAGGGSSNWRSQTRPGADGRLYWMDTVDENGKFVPSETDMPFTAPTTKIQTIHNADGSKKEVAMGGNLIANATEGKLNPKLSTEKNAENQLKGYNPYTNKAESIDSSFDQTGMGLTPDSTADYKDRLNKKNSDPALKASENLDNIGRNALTNLAHGTPLSALATVKNLSTILEGGYRSTDKDFAAVSGVNLGIANKIENLVLGFKEGGKITDAGRREIELLLSSIMNNNRDYYKRIIKRKNTELHGLLRDEMRPDLEFKELEGFDGKKQGGNVLKNLETARDFTSTGEFEEQVKRPDGSPVMENNRPVYYIYNYVKDPVSGKMKKIPIRRANR
jgi:hypothetical protein